MNQLKAIDFLAPAVYVLAFIIILVASPAYTFYTGDQGLKFIQIRTIADHGPGHLHLQEKKLPAAALERAHPDAMTYAWKGKTYPVYSPMLPLLTAPIHLVLGYGGLFLLPFLSVLGCCLLIRRLAFSLTGEGRSGRSALLLILSSPIAFYGMVLWEHAPAVLLCTTALLLFMLRRSGKALFVAGLAIGAACWFRPESLLFGVAMGLTGLLMRDTQDPRGTAGWRLHITASSMTLFAAGVLAGYLPQLLLNVETSGSIFGGSLVHHIPLMAQSWTEPHGQDAVMVEVPFWKQAWTLLVLPRLAFIYKYFLGDLWPFVTAGLLIALTGRRVMRRASIQSREKYSAALVLIFVSSTLAYTALRTVAYGAPLPFWNFWFTFPASAGLMALPCLSRPGDRRLRFLLLLCTGTVALKILVMPVGGGVQWGLRMMLPALLPLVLTVAIEMGRAETKIYRNTLMLVLTASLLIQGVGGAKIVSHRQKLAVIPEKLSRVTEPGEVIFTSYPLLYQICPVLTSDRSFLQVKTGRSIVAFLNALPSRTPVSVVSRSQEWPLLENEDLHLSHEKVDLGWGGLEFRRIESQ